MAGVLPDRDLQRLIDEGAISATVPVTPDQARLLRQGQMLFGIPAEPGLHLATEAETPVALVEVSADGCKVIRGFNLETQGV